MAWSPAPQLDEPELREVEAEPAAVVHLRIPAAACAEEFPRAVQELLAVMNEQGIAPTGPLLCHPLRWPGADFDFEFGFPVAQPITPVGRVRASELPTAHIVRSVYRGGYEGLSWAWRKFERRFVAPVAAAGMRRGDSLWERHCAGRRRAQTPTTGAPSWSCRWHRRRLSERAAVARSAASVDSGTRRAQPWPATMRILHTADWHLGHTLRDHSRAAEHAHFLRWLCATVVAREVDALLIAGDVFDAANPPPSVWRMWFEFLGELKRARPQVQVVVIAGNHDSAQRLEAPRELLRAFDVRVVGRLQRDADGRLDTGDLLVPLRGRDGGTAAWCVAIPFLRASDVMALAPRGAGGARGADGTYLLPRPGEPADGDPLIAGMRALHDELFAAARAKRQPGQALVAMAHGFLVGGALSELSERKVLAGNQHALPVDLFPADCAYVALGHLHRPQQLAGLEHVRYSGSPLPLSMPERLHAHHVVFCDLAGDRVDKIWSLRTERAVELLRIPERGELDPDAAFAAIDALPARDPQRPDELRPFLEVAVRLEQPSPQLTERVVRAVADKDVRLVRVDVALAAPSAPGAPEPPRELRSLQPEDVFVRCYRRSFDGDVPAPLLGAFRELLEQVQHDDVDGATDGVGGEVGA
ncbi:MAG: exonuclease SbcCD subunit D C-terminal domain-containing protein [Planctomycetota bacterium]